MVAVWVLGGLCVLMALGWWGAELELRAERRQARSWEDCYRQQCDSLEWARHAARRRAEANGCGHN